MKSIDVVYIKDLGDLYDLSFLNGRYKNMHVRLSSSGRALEKCRDIYQQTFFIKIFKNYIGLKRLFAISQKH